jgi:putative hydroxymethylpyrimidine transport system permease protein
MEKKMLKINCILKKYFNAYITGFLLLLFWEIFVRIMNISKWILPAPSSILRALYQVRGLLLVHSIRTIFEALIGFILAILIGLIIGGSIYYFKILSDTIYPFLLVSQTIPIVVLIPLLVIWLGYGIAPKLLIVILACFFPIAVNTIDGLSATDKEMVALLRSMGATDWQIFKLVRVPSALPTIFSGLRISASYAIMTAVVAEWMGSDIGLGVFIVRSSNSYLTERVFASILLLSIYSIAFFQGINYFEKLFIPWQKNNKE